MVTLIRIESKWILVECHETKTQDVAVTNHNSPTRSNEPIRSQDKCL